MYPSRPLPLDGVTDVVEDTVAGSATEGRGVYVGNLPFTVTEDDLKDFFFHDFSM